MGWMGSDVIGTAVGGLMLAASRRRWMRVGSRERCEFSFETVDLRFVLLTDLCVLVFQLIECTPDDAQLVNLSTD